MAEGLRRKGKKGMLAQLFVAMRYFLEIFESPADYLRFEDFGRILRFLGDVLVSCGSGIQVFKYLTG